jgi:excisionase family DNA binding protein
MAISGKAHERFSLSVPEAADILGISRFTLRAWLRQRRLPFHRIGRRIVLDLCDLDQFLMDNRVEAEKVR